MDSASLPADNPENFSVIPESECSVVKKKKVGRKTLRKQLKTSVQECDDLKTTLDKKDSEISELKKCILALNDQAKVKFSDHATKTPQQNTAKIMELNKRNSQLFTELEALKTKYNKLESEFCSLESEKRRTPIKTDGKKHLDKENEELKKIIHQKELEIADLKKKNSSNDSKVSEESKTNIIQLQTQLDAMKIKYNKLSAEMAKFRPQSGKDGTDSTKKHEPLSKQLALTKQKLFEALNQNTELKNNLKLAQKCLQQEIGDNVSLASLTSAQSKWRGRSQQILALQNKVAELQEKMETMAMGDESLQRKFDSYKRAEIDELKARIDELLEDVEDHKRKISTLKVRNKNLCEEVLNYKMKPITPKLKSEEEVNSIAILKERLNIQKHQYEAKLTDLTRKIEILSNFKRTSEPEFSRMQADMQEMAKLVQSKQAMIDERNEIIKKLETDLESANGDFMFACRDLNKDEILAILKALESEKEGLIRHVERLNKRLEEEHETISNIHAHMAKQKVKINRMKIKIKDHQREQEQQQDKKKRTRRIAAYTKSLNSGLSVKTTSIKSSREDMIRATENLESQIEELRDKLAFANERISFLGEKIANVTSEKLTNAGDFNQIMMNSRDILLNTIQDIRKQRSNPLEFNEIKPMPLVQPICLKEQIPSTARTQVVSSATLESDLNDNWDVKSV